VVLPCGDPGETAGVLLLRWEPGALPRDVAGLPPLARVMTTLLRRLAKDTSPRPVETSTPAPGAALDAGGVGSLERDVSPHASGVALRALLEEQEWNVSRVARLLGVTRMTIYNRLRRHGVRREHVPKTAKALRRTAEHATFETAAALVERDDGLKGRPNRSGPAFGAMGQRGG
jgi:hypothetical protein